MIVCYNFMNADRKYKNPGSEIKDGLLLIAVTVAKISDYIFLH